MTGPATASDRPAATGAAVARMEPAEFSAFYARTAPRLRAYLRRVTGDAALADDLLQEACIRLLRSARPGGSEGEHAAFLYRTATHLAYDHWRRRARETRALGRLDWTPAASGPPGLGPDLSRIFDRLRPRDRALLWLAHVEGRDHAEIARLLGLRRISVRVLLFRARAELARRLRRAGLSPEGGPRAPR
jgi:RNA polymerase sigma-70 factor (ECF subfamily)